MNEDKRPVQGENPRAGNSKPVTLAEPQGQGAEAEEMRASFWATRYSVAQDIQRPMQQKWGKWYKDMYAQLETSDMAVWRSKVYLPIISSKIWDLIARFIQYKPGWEVSIRSLPMMMPPDQYEQYISEMNVKYDKVKLKMEYDYDNPLRDYPIQSEIQSVMIDAAVTGTGLARVPYDTKIVEEKEHVQRGEMIDLSLEEITTSHQGFNGFEAINIFNVYKSPASKGVQDGWIIIRDYVPLSELQSRENYKNLEGLAAGAVSDDTAQFQRAKNMLVANPDQVAADSSLNLVETLECWDSESKMVTVFANSGGEFVEIFREPNIYRHGKIPFVRFTIREKPHQFWGESILENSETLQAAANDTFNHYMDELNMSDGMMAIEEGSVVEPFIVEPGGEFRYRGEAPKQWKFPEPNPAQLSTVINQIHQAVENATLSSYASGAPNSATDKTAGTATGITRLMEAAAEKIGMMRASFRRSFNEVGNMWLANTQQFMDRDIPVSSNREGNTVTEIIRPVDITGLFNLKIDEGSFEPVSKDELRENYMTYIANLTTWADASVVQAERTGDPTQALNLDFRGIALRGSEVFGENLNNFLVSETSPVDPSLTPHIIEGEEVIPGGDDAILAAEEMLGGEPALPAEPIMANESIQAPNAGIALPEPAMGL